MICVKSGCKGEVEKTDHLFRCKVCGRWQSQQELDVAMENEK